MISRFSLRFRLALACLLLGAFAPGIAAEPGSGADFSAMRVAGTGQVRLSDYARDVVLLNFWASWCFPCRYEMTLFSQLYEQLRDDGFTVLAVAVYDNLEDARRFQDQYQFTFPVLFDDRGDAREAFDVDYVPQTFLLARGGEMIPIPNPGTRETSLVVNDPTIWEHPDTLRFLQQVVRR